MAGPQTMLVYIAANGECSDADVIKRARGAGILPLLRKLPNWSSIRICGCGAKAAPAVAVAGGCVRIVSRLTAAGVTVTLIQQLAKNVVLKLQYGFAASHDQTSGGNNDYTAHMVMATMRYHF